MDVNWRGNRVLVWLETIDHGPWSLSTYFNHCLALMGKIQQKERLQKGSEIMNVQYPISNIQP